MRFDDFDKEMRKYEQSLDQVILPDMYIVARLDGRSFSKFTEKQNFEKPFDDHFRDLMVETTKYLIEHSGFRIVYGYTESDEISLLFHPKDDTFGRKVRKINTVLAGLASAFFSLKVGVPVTFDCRVIPLPNLTRVEDYFAWRQEDSHRNSLNTWCYWTLRKMGFTKGKATSWLFRKSVSYKNDLLFQYGINYNDLPNWQKRGMGVYYKKYVIDSYNPKTEERVSVNRKKIYVDYDLSSKDFYRRFVRNFCLID